MDRSYIYCITNPCMKDICKVGLTSKTLSDRLKGLNNTSVASCFKLEYYIEVNSDDRFKIEKNIHKDIVNEGYDRMPGREFFKCNPSDIIEIFKNYGEIKYEEEVNQNVMVGGKKEKIEGVKSVDKVIIEEIKIKNNICQYCNKSFFQKYNVDKHIKFNCKVKKEQDKTNISDDVLLNKLKNLIEKSNKKIDINWNNKNIKKEKLLPTILDTQNITQVLNNSIINKNKFKCNKIFERRNHLENHLLKIKPYDKILNNKQNITKLINNSNITNKFISSNKNKIEVKQIKELIEKPIVSLESIIKSDVDRPIINNNCPYCNKIFFQKYNVIKHVKLSCRIKKDMDNNNNNIFIEKLKKIFNKD